LSSSPNLIETQIQDSQKLSSLSEFHERDKIGNVCVKIAKISGSLRSRKGWEYRRLSVQDGSKIECDLLVSEIEHKKWEFRPKDCIACKVRGGGIDSLGRLTLFFQDFCDPFATSRMLFERNHSLQKARMKLLERKDVGETVYTFTEREARAFIKLCKLYFRERKPIHYNRFCDSHQIVSTNLHYLELIDQPSFMSGVYFPTSEGIDLFMGRSKFPKKKIKLSTECDFTMIVSPDAVFKSLEEYLNDYADRETIMKEYRDALEAYHEEENGLTLEAGQ